jgi:glycosyltransferase involved in cell wall biosynthesis
VRDRLSADDRRLCRFVVVGDTPDDFRPDHVAECRALAAELGLGDCFHFLGFRKDVRPLVADFDVAVVPSVYPDPLPRAVIESMALQKPVIAFDVGGIAEMVQPGRTGTLVRGAPPDVDGLAAAMLAYIGDPQRRAVEGRAARACIEREFDGAAHARAVQREIVEVIDEARVQRAHHAGARGSAG